MATTRETEVLRELVRRRAERIQRDARCVAGLVDEGTGDPEFAAAARRVFRDGAEMRRLALELQHRHFDTPKGDTNDRDHRAADRSAA